MPSTRARRLASQLDWHWTNQLRPRLAGLSDDEYLWEPAPGCWSIRAVSIGAESSAETDVESSAKTAPDWAFPAPDPPPLTTIAWRLAHIGMTLAQRANFHFGDRSLTIDRVRWPGMTASSGLAFVDAAYAAWNTGVTAVDDERLRARSDGPPGSVDGRFPFAEVILHVNREVIHHGAEVALLRDLYRALHRGE